MIKKLKFRLIILSMSSLFILLAVLVSGMNIINYNSISEEADRILEILSHNKGTFPEFKNEYNNTENFVDKPRKPMSPEVPYESRFFVVLIDDSGNVLQTNTTKIKSVNSDQAVEYGLKVSEKSNPSGFVDVYRYIISKENTGKRIIFLECRKQLDSFYSFLYASISMSVIGYIIVIAIIFFFSGKILRPIIESYEKQKRFITDAGHEIKTPLTIINANTDILEAEIGENEGIYDIRTQTKKLTELTNNLICLARMEEAEQIELIEIPISEILSETTKEFEPIIKRKNISLNLSVAPLLSIKGNTKTIEQLLSILLDNAVKYCSQNGHIMVSLQKRGKYAEISIANTVSENIPKDDLSKIFDRFYRCDPSRNSQTGGHGIGLSIAKAIVQRHSGKIYAENTDRLQFKIIVLLPT